MGKSMAAGAVAVLLVIGALVWRWTRPEPSPQYITTPVVVGDIESHVSAVGTIRAADLVSVGAQASGQIKAMRVVLGQRVKKGQLIAEIDSMPQVNALRTAEMQLASLEAQLRAGEAQLDQARLALAREKEMYSHDAAAKQDQETAQSTFLVDQSNVESLKAQISSEQPAVDTARVTLGYTRITAPSDGVVVAILAVQGQTVNANQSTPNIVKLANLDTVTIKAQISEADVVHLKPGLPAYFTILGDPDRRYQTTLRAIEPAPDSISTDTSTTTAATTGTNAVYYNGLLDVPNRDGRLRISMTAQVTIVLAHVAHAVLIPSAALMSGSRRDTGTVRVLDANGHPVLRKVRLGVDDSASVQILDGLRPGERVIVGESSESAAHTPFVQGT